ncbi:MAG: hypothetical protein ABL866_09740 [Devosia sp.]
MVVLLALDIYVDYGTSGSYTGHGTIGFGAQVDFLRVTTAAAVQYAFVVPPTLAAILLAHWTWLRGRARVLFWPALALLIAIQLLVGFMVIGELLDASS